MFSTRFKLAIAKYLSAAIFTLIKFGGGNPRCIKCRRKGINWELNLEEGIDLALFLFGAFEWETASTLNRLTKPGMCVIDIGANIGAHALPLARAVSGSGKVLAVEPTDWAYGKLCRNLELNREHCSVLIPVQAFLNDGVAQLPERICSSWPVGRTIDDTHPVHGGLAKGTAGAVSLTLDELVLSHNLQRVDLIKLDVDGFEAQVLRGGGEVLRRFRPMLVVELCIYPHQETGGSFASFLSELRTHEYTLRNLSNGRELPMDVDGLQRLIPRGGGINALALPRLAEAKI